MRSDRSRKGRSANYGQCPWKKRTDTRSRSCEDTQSLSHEFASKGRVKVAGKALEAGRGARKISPRFGGHTDHSSLQSSETVSVVPSCLVCGAPSQQAQESNTEECKNRSKGGHFSRKLLPASKSLPPQPSRAAKASLLTLICLQRAVEGGGNFRATCNH